MRKAKKISIILAVLCIGTISFVPLSSAFDADYGVFIFTPGVGIMSDMLSLTYDGAVILDSSYGSGTYIELENTFVAYYYTVDLFAQPAIITMTGIVMNPLIFAVGTTSMGGHINSFGLMGRLLWNYDYGEEE
jgi:hypothetical protein